jgi:hypothetical protein
MSSVAVEDTIPTAAQADTVSIQSIEKNGKKPPRGVANEAELITARGNVISKDGVVFSSNDSDDSLAGNIFADPEVAAYYKDVYEKAKYECRHVFEGGYPETRSPRLFLGLYYVLCSASGPRQFGPGCVWYFPEGFEPYH